MATETRAARLRVPSTPLARIAQLGWPTPAWGAIGVVALFVGVTCWWVSENGSIPIFDAGLHLSLGINVYNELAAGHFGTALTLSAPYPPFAYLVGSLGILLGGLSIPAMVITENLVFVTLLALGCYKVGRLAFSPLAGLLAVVFALGSPLISAQFHVFMTDAPETAMVAVSVWLIIASEGFSKLRVCALAGVACGLGMLTKEPFPIFVIGVVLVTAVRGGPRSWRGLALFGGIALALALPWYIAELATIKAIGGQATSSTSAYGSGGGYSPSGIAPPRLSSTNLEWYFWSMVNSLLLVPLFVLAAIGWLWLMHGFIRRRWVSRLAPELAIGSFVAWALLTETFFHDTRYDMPLLIYPAVFAGGWIASLKGRWRVLGTAALAAAVGATVLGVTFGVGSEQSVNLVRPDGALEEPGTLTFYNKGFLVSAPERDGDLLGMLRALRREGVHVLTWPPGEGAEPDFSNGGVTALAQVAELEPRAGSPYAALGAHFAVLAHAKIGPSEAPPCVELSDHSGVWVRIGNPVAPGARDYCPLPRPHYYGPKQA
ncbi:MAG TPA: glycosyltransferase family 39 protein [Solirubrobacteraceae bacterium]|jgi:4-amino-4-deoxy-L-arabinose transferase-like glycosyltransferase|nr:glycosyltransferase family 39 protein [Solirubrobacteraceae bacterium]